MPDLGKLAEFGVAGIALVVVLVLVMALVEIVKRKVLGKDTCAAPAVIDCPNKVEGLAATMVALCNESREQTRLNTEQLKALQHNSDGIDRLIDQHKPGVDGREMWKTTTRSERTQEESRDLLRELVTVVKRNGFGKK